MMANTHKRGLSDESEIREVLDDRINALRTKDAERIMSYFAPGFATFELAPPLQHLNGDPRDTSGLETWFSSFEGPMDYEMRDLSITTSDSVAFSHCLYRISGTKSDGDYINVDRSGSVRRCPETDQ